MSDRTTPPDASRASEFIVDPTIRTHSDTLNDGREIIYFDDRDTALSGDRLADARTLDPRPATATMRLDPLTGDWVSIAEARQNRVFLPSADKDPLAPASASNPSEIPDNYDVAVFENRSPSFGPRRAESAEEAASELSDLETIALGQKRPSLGRCEVVAFSPAHEGAFGSLTLSRARTVVEAWASRTAALSAIPGVRQVFPFENRGQAIGVTLHHPHGQIYAYPYVTPRTQRLIDSVESYGPSLFADILAHEQSSERMLVQGEHWSAFVPFAARWPVEVHLLPHRHIPDLAATSLAERDELAAIYLRVLRALDLVYDAPMPYIAAWHQAPTDSHRDDIRLMMQITSPQRSSDKLKFLAGSEAAMGAWIGDVAPEASAQLLRTALERVDREWNIHGKNDTMTTTSASAAFAAQRFSEITGRPADGVWEAPGRANLIGEHTDYNEGFVLPFAIDRHTWAAMAPRDDSQARVTSGFSASAASAVSVDLRNLTAEALNDWSAYPLGVAWAIIEKLVQDGRAEEAAKLPGFDLHLESNVPVGAGLSSSAAIECATAVALNELWGLGFDARTLAKIGQRAENVAVGAPTGIMDQSASLLGQADHAVFLDCRSLESAAVPLGLAEAGLEVLVIDTTVSHAHSTGGYASRRASCERGAEVMGRSSLREVSVADLAQAESLLDDETFRRVRHVVTENQRVLDTVELLRTEGAAAIGALLDASHVSMRDDFEISIPELDLAVTVSREAGAIGSRMTGGGFGGAAIAVIPSELRESITDALLNAFAAANYATPNIFAVSAGAGATRANGF